MSGREALLRAVREEARERGTALFAAFAEPVATLDPLALFAAGTGTRFFLARPAEDSALVALGACARVETRGADRFARAAAECEALLARVRVAGAAAPHAPWAKARLVGGFAFDREPDPSGAWRGWPALSFELPGLLVVRAGGAALATACVEVAPNADASRLEAQLAGTLARAVSASAAPPPDAPRALGFAARADGAPEAYERAVARALAAVARGEIEKVVLARACTLARRAAFAPEQVLARLCAQHPGCTVFGVALGDACFVGATPERLVARHGARVRASALAGSAPRGRTTEEDARLARALRESKKEQEEHAIVRRDLARALAPVCARLDAPESPEILQLDSIQHLHTPFEGELRPGPEAALLRLAERIHPTPAVCGAPLEAARAFLAAHERQRRGWYAGGVGWLGSDGDGELTVPLRCALLRGRRAVLYAGAGVVRGSRPEAELAETSLKLRAALPALVDL